MTDVKNTSGDKQNWLMKYVFTQKLKRRLLK